MLSQAYSVEADQQEDQPFRTVARNTGEFAEDVLTLAELQAKLLMLESREWIQSQLLFVAVGTAGVAIGAGLIPIVFLTVAAILVESAGLSNAQALFASTCLGMLVVGGLLGSAYAMSRKITTPFKRSSREWDTNFRWIRNMLRRQARRW